MSEQKQTKTVQKKKAPAPAGLAPPQPPIQPVVIAIPQIAAPIK
jgi:hypothetical protein